MSELSAGDTAPDFTLPASGGGTVSLSDYLGQKVVLFLYPKDDTPGCTKEAIGFTESMPDFQNAGAVVIGLSKDPVAKHDKFVAKHSLGMVLASDENDQTVEAYGAWVQKSMYGKTYMGIERSTFLIGPDGKLLQIWRKVKVPGHVEAVLEAVRAA